MKDKESKEFKFKLTTSKQIDIFNEWIKSLQQENKKVATEVKKIVFDFLKNNQNRNQHKEYWNDLFYTIRKAMFASMVGFSNKIKQEYASLFAETKLLHLKLNIILNYMLKNDEFDFGEQSIKFMSGGILEELDYFKEQREIFLKDIKQLYKNKNAEKENLVRAAENVQNEFEREWSDEEEV